MNSNQHLSEPTPGTGEIYQLPTERIPNLENTDYKQPWSEYEPNCQLHDTASCNCSVQKENIKPAGIYENIETQGDKWMKQVCNIARKSVEKNGGPFGAIILQIDGETGEILRHWENNNQVTSSNDPSAHAEIMAIRSACSSLGVFDLGEIKKENSKLSQPNELSTCVIYSSTEPCPMCYSAICWARISTLLFAATRFDAAAEGVGFSDAEIYKDLEKPYAERNMKVVQCTTDNSLDAFNLWKRVEKEEY